ncbi:hypothetical protein PR202_gb22599 [Eleusine coracana subsp. coracana]|uniref:RING-type domain-containing protein n=1 Tax=Eleusine coracana subsp. coracana TaxID=191504 RepID=A0AAV5FH43_ELECO|nr:hypothetical protein QOZ80_6AG0535530 [Eleusine coracana subsp. coracana]GJN33968.1 hypothetical protein PR202_gb22599 [Eleusine coracana subsp. coracana]
MVLETRIRCRLTGLRLKGHEGLAPREEGPSSLRLICKATVQHASRRLGGAEAERGWPPTTSESKTKRRVDDPSVFLDYNGTREIVWRAFGRLPGLRDIDLAHANWHEFTTSTITSKILQVVRDNHDKGRCGGHYRFVVDLDVEVALVFSEPKALLRYCSEEVMQTLEDSATGEPCGICLDGLASCNRTPPLNLPCGHAFHSNCIAKWFFKGTACPLCRHDLRGLVAAPWATGPC